MKPDRKKYAQRQFTLWTEPAWSASRAERPASTTPAVTAVYIGDPTETWRASIGFQGKVYNLGTFTAFNEAVQARVKAEKELYDPFIRSFQAQKKETSGK